MTGHGFDFQKLITPIAVDQFFAQYWENSPLGLQNRDPHYYHDLFSLADIDRILIYSKPQPPKIRLIKNQTDFPPQRYVKDDGNLHLNQIYKAYDEGHTLIINGIEQFHQAIASFCGHLQNFLNHQVIANFYLSPAHSQGLNPHYDTHDVFVLQIEGSKTWKIYEPRQKLPLLGSFQPVISHEELGEPIKTIHLQAGDLLYIPRGFVHEAITSDDFSLHMTIGIYPSQWVDLIYQSLVALSFRDTRLREALPAGFLDQPESRERVKELFDELMNDVVNKMQAEEGLALLEDALIRQNNIVAADDHLKQLNLLDAITVETVVARRENIRCRVLDRVKSVAIQFSGNTISGSRQILEALNFIVQSQQFAVKELPGELSSEGKIKLVQRLVRGGLLQVQSNSS